MDEHIFEPNDLFKCLQTNTLHQITEKTVHSENDVPRISYKIEPGIIIKNKIYQYLREEDLFSFRFQLLALGEVPNG